MFPVVELRVWSAVINSSAFVLVLRHGRNKRLDDDRNKNVKNLEVGIGGISFGDAYLIEGKCDSLLLLLLFRVAFFTRKVLKKATAIFVKVTFDFRSVFFVYGIGNMKCKYWKNWLLFVRDCVCVFMRSCRYVNVVKFSYTLMFG